VKRKIYTFKISVYWEVSNSVRLQWYRKSKAKQNCFWNEQQLPFSKSLLIFLLIWTRRSNDYTNAPASKQTHLLSNKQKDFSKQLYFFKHCTLFRFLHNMVHIIVSLAGLCGHEIWPSSGPSLTKVSGHWHNWRGSAKGQIPSWSSDVRLLKKYPPPPLRLPFHPKQFV